MAKVPAALAKTAAISVQSCVVMDSANPRQGSHCLTTAIISALSSALPILLLAQAHIRLSLPRITEPPQLPRHAVHPMLERVHRLAAAIVHLFTLLILFFEGVPNPFEIRDLTVVLGQLLIGPGDVRRHQPLSTLNHIIFHNFFNIFIFGLYIDHCCIKM